MMPLVQVSPQVQGVLLSHIYEHISLAAQQIVKQKTQEPVQGVDPFGQPIMLPPTPVDEKTYNNMVAQAEVQLQQQVMQMMQPPQQQGPDPLIELQQQNLQIKAQQVAQKAQTEQERIALDRQKLAMRDSLDRERMQSNEDIAQLRANVSLQRAGVA